MKKLASSGELSPEQTDFLAWLDELWFDAAVRALAHELSSTWHRRRASIIGIGATLVSALVAVSLFAIAVSESGLAPLTQSWRPLLFAMFGLAILAPVLAAVQANLRDHEHAEVHHKTSAGYFRLQQKLDLWRLDVQQSELPSRDQRVYASQEREELFKGGAIPLRRALRVAERRVRAELRGRAKLGDLRSAITSDARLQDGIDWSWGRLRGVGSAAWLPASYLAAALYLGRSPQPLADRIGTLLVVVGLALLLRALSIPSAIAPSRHRWLYRCLPSRVGLAVLLILLGNLLLFPSLELQVCTVLWLLLDLGLRKQASSSAALSSTARRSIPPALPRVAVWSTQPAAPARGSDV